MADQKISDLTELAVAPADDDYLVILDTDAATTKKVSVSTAIEKWTFLTTPLTSTSWDGDAFSTVAKTLIDLSTVFGVPAGVKAVLVTTAIRDSGSAAGDCTFTLSPNDGSLNGPKIGCSGLANDAFAYSTFIVPCDSNGDIYYQIVASGSGTMDVYLQIWGYWL